MCACARMTAEMREYSGRCFQNASMWAMVWPGPAPTVRLPRPWTYQFFTNTQTLTFFPYLRGGLSVRPQARRLGGTSGLKQRLPMVAPYKEELESTEPACLKCPPHWRNLSKLPRQKINVNGPKSFIRHIMNFTRKTRGRRSYAC